VREGEKGGEILSTQTSVLLDLLTDDPGSPTGSPLICL